MTQQQFITADSRQLNMIPDKSIDFIVTSPPYPMVQMWDNIFAKQNPSIQNDMNENKDVIAFQKMHNVLNTVWTECDRILKDNRFICINIGDATRTIADKFKLYSNHTQIISFFTNLGYTLLPDIHWKKPSNSPTKFMGSGMYPAGAYVTYEHEYILIFRKGDKRTFNSKEKERRQKSAYFWEERNKWFSDIWEIVGTTQKITEKQSNRQRNASFPLEIPYRLINMYSIENDTVLDPFSGLGTTSLACILSQRNSYGIDIDETMQQMACQQIMQSENKLNNFIENRLNRHINFINNLPDDKLQKCYLNEHHHFKVKTQQEKKIHIEKIKSMQLLNNTIITEYI